MASSYTSPLILVRDVETCILDGTVLEFLHAGQGQEDVKRVGGWLRRDYPGGIKQIKQQSMSTQENTGGVKNGLVNNLAVEEDSLEWSKRALNLYTGWWWWCLSMSGCCCA